MLIRASFARQSAGVNLDYATWALGAVVPGIIALVLTPLVVYYTSPPELKATTAAAATVHPDSINSTRRRRPSGVSGALRCTRASLGIAKPSDSSTLAQGAQPSADVTNVPNYNTLGADAP